MAALIVRIVRGWANDMAVTTKEGQHADVVPPIDLENVYGRAFRSTCVEAARTACPQLAAICAAQWEPCDTRFWQRCDDGWTLDSTTRSGWQGSRAMQVVFVLGLEFALSMSDELAPSEITRVGLQDDMTFTGSAAALNRSWVPLKVCWPKQVTDSVVTNVEYGRLDLSSLIEVRNLCLKIPRKRHWGEPAWEH